MANATSTQLQELYVAYFGRAADPSGLDYWTTKGITTAKFAADMYAQLEFKDVYGSLSVESQVNQIYQNLFDRNADRDGLLYWTLEIDLGNIQLAEIAIHLIYAAQNNAGSEDDKTALANKSNAAIAYTAKVKETTDGILAYQAESESPWVAGSNIAEAVSFLSDINKDTEATTAAIASSVATIVANGVPSLAKNYSLTSGIDDIAGTAGTNKISAGLTSAGGNTLNSLDEIDGGAGTDTLNASIATSITPGELKNVENVNLTFETATKTFNATNATGITTLSDVGSTNAGTITNLSDTSTNLKVSDNSVGTTFVYKTSAVTGTADSIDLEMANATGGNGTELNITGAVETINLTSSTSANDQELNSVATTLNISGSADLTLDVDSTILDVATTINASSFTGALTLDSDNTVAAGAVTITGGSGNDSLTLSGANTATDTVSGGAGNDTITFSADLADADVVNGGEGTADTLVADDGQIAALTTANNVSNIEVLQASTVLATSLTTANVDSSIASVTLAGGANAGTVVFGAGSNTLTMGAANAGALTVTDTGLATNDTLTITASNTADSFNNNSVAINGFETVNFNTGTGGTDALEQDLSTFNVTGDPDSAGLRTAATLTITGASDWHTTGIITLGTDGSGTGTIDAAGLTGNLEMGAATAGATTITGGTGNDIILGDSHASTLTGGAGDDTITGGAASDTISGGDGNDTFNLTEGGTAASSTADTITGGAGNDTFQGTDAVLDATHVLNGGEGTDTISLSDITAVTDDQLANKSSIEVVTSAATGLAATLGTNAQAMGITTITLAGTAAGGIADTVTIAAGVTNALTVNVDALNDGGDPDDTNTVDASAYTGTLTITTAAATAIRGAAGNAAAGEAVYTGGTGTSDTLNFHGGTFTNTQLTGITAIENWVQSDDVSSSLTLDELNIADGKSLVIDLRSIVNASNTSTVNLADDSNGTTTVHGSTGIDTFTGSASDLGDTLNAYAGADVINFAAANLTTLDTVDGGTGSDTLTITSDAVIADADFTNVSNIEALTYTAAASNTDLGAEYVESGSSTITLTTGTNNLNLDAVTSAQTVNLVAGTDTLDASSMTGVLTVDYASSQALTSADTLTGGTTSTDILEVTFDTTAADFTNVTAFETIKSGADTASQAFTTFDANVASTESLTIDMSAQATNAYAVTISAETNGAITITGGAAAGTITLSSSSLGDTFTGGAAADGVTVIGAQLTSDDTLNGAGGTDTLTIGTVGTLSDADFTNVSNFETMTIGGAGAITAVLGSEYAGSGLTTINEYANGDTSAVNITYGSGVTTAQTYALSTSSTTIAATGMTGVLTVTAAEASLTSADTITGGSGTDVLSMTFSGTAATSGDIGSVTSIETWKSATNHVGGFTFNDANFVSNNFSVNAALTTSAAFTVDASAENDSTMTYTGGGGIDTVTGTSTTATGDTITSGAGADVITGDAGGDTITGGAGADTFTYTAVGHSTGSARDTISDFTSGTDKFSFTINNSTQVGGQTYDATIQTARAGTSLVQSNLSGAIGQVVYDTTNSRLIVNANADNLVSTLDYQIDVNAASTAASTVASGDIKFSITGGSGADTITTGGGDDTIVTGNGGGTVTAGAGADTITGGTGADTIIGGTGADTIAVGSGIDTVTYSSLTDGLSAVITLTDVSDATDDFTATAGTTVDSITTDWAVASDFIKIDGTLEALLEASAADVAIANGGANFDYNSNGIAILTGAAATLAADDFGDITAVKTAFEAGTGTATNAAAGDEILFTLEGNTANLTGLYYFKDVDGNADITAGDQIALLAIIADDTLTGTEVIL